MQAAKNAEMPALDDISTYLLLIQINSLRSIESIASGECSFLRCNDNSYYVKMNGAGGNNNNFADIKLPNALELSIPGLTNLARHIASISQMSLKLSSFQNKLPASQPSWTKAVEEMSLQASRQLETIKLHIANAKWLDERTIELLRESSMKWNELLKMRYLGRPQNWDSYSDPSEWFHDFYTTSAHGWLLIESPRSGLTRLLAKTPIQDRASCALSKSTEIANSFEMLATDEWPNTYKEYKTALRDLVKCILGENWIATQTLSMVIMSSLGENKILSGQQIRRSSLESLPDYESMTNDLELTAVISALLYFWPEDSSDKAILSRNASLHHLDERQQTPANAIQSAVTAVSTLMHLVNRSWQLQMSPQ